MIDTIKNLHLYDFILPRSLQHDGDGVIPLQQSVVQSAVAAWVGTYGLDSNCSSSSFTKGADEVASSLVGKKVTPILVPLCPLPPFAMAHPMGSFPLSSHLKKPSAFCVPSIQSSTTSASSAALHGTHYIRCFLQFQLLCVFFQHTLVSLQSTIIQILKSVCSELDQEKKKEKKISEETVMHHSHRFIVQILMDALLSLALSASSESALLWSQAIARLISNTFDSSLLETYLKERPEHNSTGEGDMDWHVSNLPAQIAAAFQFAVNTVYKEMILGIARGEQPDNGCMPFISELNVKGLQPADFFLLRRNRFSKCRIADNFLNLIAGVISHFGYEWTYSEWEGAGLRQSPSFAVAFPSSVVMEDLVRIISDNSFEERVQSALPEGLWNYIPTPSFPTPSSIFKNIADSVRIAGTRYPAAHAALRACEKLSPFFETMQAVQSLLQSGDPTVEELESTLKDHANKTTSMMKILSLPGRQKEIERDNMLHDILLAALLSQVVSHSGSSLVAFHCNVLFRKAEALLKGWFHRKKHQEEMGGEEHSETAAGSQHHRLLALKGAIARSPWISLILTCSFTLTEKFAEDTDASPFDESALQQLAHFILQVFETDPTLVTADDLGTLAQFLIHPNTISSSSLSSAGTGGVKCSAFVQRQWARKWIREMLNVVCVHWLDWCNLQNVPTTASSSSTGKRLRSPNEHQEGGSSASFPAQNHSVMDTGIYVEGFLQPMMVSATSRSLHTSFFTSPHSKGLLVSNIRGVLNAVLLALCSEAQFLCSALLPHFASAAQKYGATQPLTSHAVRMKIQYGSVLIDLIFEMLSEFAPLYVPAILCADAVEKQGWVDVLDNLSRSVGDLLSASVQIQESGERKEETQQRQQLRECLSSWAWKLESGASELHKATHSEIRYFQIPTASAHVTIEETVGRYLSTLATGST